MISSSQSCAKKGPKCESSHEFILTPSLTLFPFCVLGPPKRGQKEETSSHSSSHQSLAHRAIESFNNKVQSLSSKLPKKAWQEDPTSDDEGKQRSTLTFVEHF